MAQVLLGWAGIGKTVLARLYPMQVCDLESSQYKWQEEPSEANKGRLDRTLNPDFPFNYLEAVQTARLHYELVMVPSLPEISEILDEYNIPHTWVMPSSEDYDLYISRYINRGNEPHFYNKIKKLWDIVDMFNQSSESNVVILPSGGTLEKYLNSEDNVFNLKLQGGKRYGESEK